MNYPTVLQNPLLRKTETREEKMMMQQKVKFSNMQRPISGFQLSSSF